MIDRRSALSMLALALAGLTPAAAQEWHERGKGGGRGRRHRRGRGRRRRDHEFARRALREGRARPLADILSDAKDDIGGDVIEVELEERAGAVVYELTVLRPNGEIVELYLDALTGSVLSRDGG